MTAPSGMARQLVRRRVEALMTSTVRILRGSLAELDPVTGDVGGLNNARTIYLGKARIRTVNGAGVVAIGEGTIDTRSTVISIPSSSPLPHRDDVVMVVDDDLADASLDAHYFRVLDVDAGSLFGDARRMSCQGFAASRYWGES